ncbi:hypothetical protein GGX14DRAFT_627005 [Mycena pura]|uniref:Uncharacterized protein n=1 Tax=Mycena pura TaxID=153505 RepID=A0AAD6YQN3_9AGAR|nr:hypothetical protein GGX14DRAFT_627005 [Mycena pura]
MANNRRAGTSDQPYRVLASFRAVPRPLVWLTVYPAFSGVRSTRVRFMMEHSTRARTRSTRRTAPRNAEGYINSRDCRTGTNRLPPLVKHAAQCAASLRTGSICLIARAAAKRDAKRAQARQALPGETRRVTSACLSRAVSEAATRPVLPQQRQSGHARAVVSGVDSAPVGGAQALRQCFQRTLCGHVRREDVLHSMTSAIVWCPTGLKLNVKPRGAPAPTPQVAQVATARCRASVLLYPESCTNLVVRGGMVQIMVRTVA